MAACNVEDSNDVYLLKFRDDIISIKDASIAEYNANRTSNALCRSTNRVRHISISFCFLVSQSLSIHDSRL